MTDDQSATAPCPPEAAAAFSGRPGASQRPASAASAATRFRRLIGLARSTHAQLLIRAGWIAVFSLCVKVAALGKDIFVARALGASAELDCFLVAFAIPMYVWAVAAQSFSTAFIPTLVRVREQSGQAEADALIRSTLTKVIGGLLALSVVLVLVAPWILPPLAWGFDAEELALAGRLFGILVWVVPLSGLSAYLGGILNCFDSYAVVALAPIAIPVAMLIGVVTFVPRYGIEALAVSVVIAFALELLILAGWMRWKRLPLLPSWKRHAEERNVLGQFGHLFVGAMLMSSSPLVDQSMASWFGSGSVSILNYGNKLAAVMVGTISVGLGAAIFPHFSRLAASRDTRGIRQTLGSLVKVVGLAAIGATGLLILASRPLAELFFYRGAMTAETIALVTRVQSCYLLQVPAYVVNILNVRMLMALGGSRTIGRIAAANLAVNVVGNLVLLHFVGIAGIALSTSLVYLVCAGLVYYHLHRRLDALAASQSSEVPATRAA